MSDGVVIVKPPAQKVVVQGSIATVPANSVRNAQVAPDANVDQSKIAGLIAALAAKATGTDLTAEVNRAIAAEAALALSQLSDPVITATTGSSYTLHVDQAPVFNLTLGANSNLSLSGAATGRATSIMVFLWQPQSGGPYAPTTWNNVTWTSAPVYKTAAGALNVFQLETTDGTSWTGYPDVLADGTLPAQVAANTSGLAAEITRAQASEGTNATAIAAKYTKPGSGIPESDLAAGVQSAIDAVATNTTGISTNATAISNEVSRATAAEATNAAAIATKANKSALHYFAATDFGVVADGSTDDRANLTTCINAAVAVATTGRGAVVQLPPGGILFNSPNPTVPSGYTGANCGIPLPVNLSGHLVIRGAGTGVTTIKLTSNCRNAFWINKQADYDVFQNFTFEDFDVDNNNSPGRCHVLIGSVPEYITTQLRLSFQNLRVRRMRTYGYTVDMTQSTQYKAFVQLWGRHSADNESTQTYSKNIVCEDIRMDDVQQGLLVNSAVTYSHNHYYDEIKFRRCKHKITTIPAATLQQTSFYICGAGFGDYAEIVDCYSENIGDDGIEMGPMQTVLIDRFRSVNAYLDSILFRMTHPASDPQSQRITVRDSRFDVTAAPFAVSGITGFRANPIAFTIDSQASSYNFGEVSLMRLNHTVTGAVQSKFARSGNVLGWRVVGQIRRATMSDCSVRYLNFNYDSSASQDFYFIGTSLFPTGLSNTGVNSPAECVIRDAEVHMDGTTNTSTGQMFTHGIQVQGTRGRCVVDGLNVSLLNSALSSSTLAYIGTGGSTMEAIELRRITGMTFNTSMGRRGIRVVGTASVSALSVIGCDFRQWTSSGLLDVDLSAATATTLAGFYASNNKYGQPTGLVAKSAAYTALSTDATILCTAGASGWALTLPAVASGQRLEVKKVDSGVGAITVTPASGTIDGQSSYAIRSQNDAITVVSDGTNWWIL